MTLLRKLRIAVQNNEINSPFTTKDLKEWINTEGIINDKKEKAYSAKYIEGFLSSSTVNSTATKSDKGLEKLGTTPESYRFIEED